MYILEIDDNVMHSILEIANTEPIIESLDMKPPTLEGRPIIETLDIKPPTLEGRDWCSSCLCPSGRPICTSCCFPKNEDM